MRKVALLVLISGLLHAQPGGIGDSKLWIRADSGTSCTTEGCSPATWSAAAGSSPGTFNRQDGNPVYKKKAFNFNPALGFSSDAHYRANGAVDAQGKKMTVFVVGKQQDTTGDTWQCFLNANADWSWRGGGFGMCSLSSDNTKIGLWVNNYSSHNATDGTVTTPTIMTGKYDGTKLHYYTNGIQRADDSYTGNIGKRVNYVYLGAGSSSSYELNGELAEVLVYAKKLSNANRHKVESYLAIKYGITLDQSGGGQNYKNSNGTTIWSNDSTYGHDIAGLERDDDSELDQKISKSINSDAVVTMATNNDFTSSNLDTSRPQLSSNDRRSLVWGNNNGTFNWSTNHAPLGGKILDRKWKARKIGNNQHNVSLQVDASGFDSFTGDLYFVKAGNMNGLATATPIKMTNDGGGKYHIENVDFSDKDIFSFVIPDAVPNNAELVINEILYRQKSSGKNNEEFVEFYVKTGGTLKDLLVTDQDSVNHEYRFEDRVVSAGDYVVLYIGDGTESHAAGVHRYYMGDNPMLNNTNDDIVLLKRSSTDTTVLDGRSIFYVPADYASYSANGGSDVINGIPPTTQNPTIIWANGPINSHGANKLQSISLTPNGQDSNNAHDWEITTSDDASGPMTIDYNNNSVNGTEFVCSDGHDNNGLPEMHITKTSIVIDDPVNGTSNPKRIPGATIRYCFTVKNTGTGNADNVQIHDTLDGSNLEKLTYQHSGKGAIVGNSGDCSEGDCAGITDTSGSYDSNTKKVDIDLATPFPPENHQCAYAETVLQ